MSFSDVFLSSDAHIYSLDIKKNIYPIIRINTINIFIPFYLTTRKMRHAAKNNDVDG